MDPNIDLILEYDNPNLVNLREEKVLVAKKEHWVVLLKPLSLVFFITFVFIFIAIFIYFFTNSIVLSLLLVVLAFLFCLSLISKTLIEWYFHIFIATDRKLLEIKFSPSSSTLSNDIMLDQVKCTEIDIKAEGLLNELLGVGNVTFTFDRPVGRKNFKMTSVKHYREVGKFLSYELIQKPQDTTATAPNPQWYQSVENPGDFILTDEIPTKKSRNVQQR